MEEKYISYYSPLQDRSDHIKGQHRQEILSELAQGVLDKGRMLRSILQCKSTSNTLYEIINVARAEKKKKRKDMTAHMTRQIGFLTQGFFAIL